MFISRCDFEMVVNMLLWTLNEKTVNMLVCENKVLYIKQMNYLSPHLIHRTTLPHHSSSFTGAVDWEDWDK